jgi:hypothetical protein
MSWIFLVGVACDGVGGFLIAWPILRPGSAAREAGRPRLGGDPWAPFVRDREARLVQYGALFLVGGFALQATGYLIRLHDLWWLALLILVLVVLGGLRIGTWLAQHDLPKHVWHPDLQPSDRITDGFVLFGVGDLTDLESVLERFVREHGKNVEAIDQGSEAYVAGGAWWVSCPRCHRPTAATTPSWRKAICVNCGAKYNVKYPEPKKRAEIEAALVTRPDAAQRRWVSGES